MASMDVFKADAFSMMSLTDAANLIDFKPQFLGSLDMFDPKPVTTITVSIEDRDQTLSLVPTSERGSAATQRSQGARKLRKLDTVRLKLSDRIHASELLGIRAFGSESEVQSVADEVARRQMEIIDDIELTSENMKLGAVQGIVTDADGSTIVDYFSEFGIAQPAEIGFDIDNTAEGQLRSKFTTQVVRPVRRNSKGLVLATDRIYALCGDSFWDKFMAHAEIRAAFKNRPGAEALLEQTAFQQFDFAGIRFVNYQGTDDNTTVAIPTDKVKFFPASRRVFHVAFSPGESFDAVGRPGTEFVSQIVVDRDRNEWADVEVASYPLYICRRPQVLFRGREGA